MKALLALLMTIIAILWLFMSFCGGITILFSSGEWWPMILWWIFMIVGSIFIYNFFTQEYNQDEALLTKIFKNLGKAVFLTLATLLILVWWIGTLCGWLMVGSWEFSGIIFLGIWLIITFIGISLIRPNNNKQNTWDTQKSESNLSQNNSVNIEK